MRSFFTILFCSTRDLSEPCNLRLHLGCHHHIGQWSTHLREEIGNVLSLISLHLDHLTELFVLHDCAIAAVVFLECLQDLLVVEALLNPLQQCSSQLVADSNLARCKQVLVPVSQCSPGQWSETCARYAAESECARNLSWSKSRLPSHP